MSSRPSPLISYAQNGEDIVLARALNPWDKKGFWVDCGAGHPKYDSVTKLFSQFGWTGINIEPLDQEFLLLSQDRPQDENIQCLLGAKEGLGIIFAGPAENRGSSTSDPLLVARYAKEYGQTFQELQIPMRRLDDILREKDRPTIDFLKIDVEGAEEEVLQGINLQEFKPRVLVIEATLPNSKDFSFAAWEPLVLDNGYLFAFFDGLNRYYVHRNDKDLLGPLAVPANVLDAYKTIVQLETEDQNRHLTESNFAADHYVESLSNTIKEKDLYAESLSNTIKEKDLYAESLSNTIKEKDLYVESLSNTIKEKDLYVESLSNTIKEKDLSLADELQKVIDIETRLVILKVANEALEDHLVILHDTERQLATIRSYKTFKFLSLAKKIIRKMYGRK